MFDATIAIAELEIKGLGSSYRHNLDGLRDKYPELRFLFDEYENQRARIESFDGLDETDIDQIHEEIDDLKLDIERARENMSDVMIRVESLSDQIGTLLQFDTVPKDLLIQVKGELNSIADYIVSTKP